jgi:flagellar hook-associated protein 2
MEGIEMFRPSNNIDDIIPGVTITAKGVSERPVRIGVQADRAGIKNAIIDLVGNYNLVMAEINVLTARSLASGMNARVDDSIINELSYLSAEEAAGMRERLGGFANDSTLSQLKTSLQRTVTSPYPTEAGRDLALLAQIGIGSNASGSNASGYSYSRLRGYLEIDPNPLDAAIERDLISIKQLFGMDTDGDLISDTGVALNLDALARPFVETGGNIALKTGTIDTRISQDTRRIETMDRQLAQKEADLRMQYSRMESAYARMEQMSNSLDNFSRQNSNNR